MLYFGAGTTQKKWYEKFASSNYQNKRHGNSLSVLLLNLTLKEHKTYTVKEPHSKINT